MDFLPRYRRLAVDKKKFFKKNLNRGLGLIIKVEYGISYLDVVELVEICILSEKYILLGLLSRC